jgi:DNA-binding response OmpR family regulator
VAVGSRSGTRKRILVVEDDVTSARMVRDYLEAHGYDISVASSGTEGLERFQREQPDLMIVDVALPRKSGFELCFDVKRTTHGQQMPLLLMSAVYRDTDQASAYAKDGLRAQGYLAKPFDLAVLLARVETLLSAPPT